MADEVKHGLEELRKKAFKRNLGGYHSTLVALADAEKIVSNLERKLEQAQKALDVAIVTIGGLADQQAMPDDWYLANSQSLKRLSSPSLRERSPPMPNSPNRKRGRIGLTLAPDVHDILDKHGDREGESRPTRTEIIEAAVRLWDGIGMRIFTREELQTIMALGESEGVKRLISEWKRSKTK